MIVGGGHAKHHDEYIQRYLRTGEKRVMGLRRELQARRANGSEFWIELGLTEVTTDDGEDRLFTGFIRDLTVLKRKQRLTAGIIDASFDSVFAINEKGIINMVNKAAIKQFGWPENKFLGSNISMIVGGGHAKNHDKYIQRYLKTGEKRVMGVRRELSARRADGSEFPIELGLAEVKVSDGEEREFVGFVRDISLQKKQEAELVEKQRTTEGLVEASLDAMFAIDEQCRIQIVNNAAVKQFGWSREEFLGRNICMIMGPDHSGEVI
jgi:PAS domain S-box-containing protein